MKKLFTIILALFGLSAFSQNLLINTIPGGCQVVKTTINDTAYYSNSVGGFARIRQSGKTYLYTKLGGQIASVELYSSISINDSVYPTIPDFIDAINALPFFSTTQAGTLWTTNAGYYAPTDVKPFRFGFQGYEIVNDSIDFGIFKLPFVGSTAGNYGSYKSLFGFGDASVIGGSRAHFLGYIDLFNGRYNAIEVLDTTSISLRNDTTQATLNANGFVLPKMGAEPTGEPGSVYFNQNTTEFRAYNGTQFRTVVTLSGASGSPVGSVTPAHEGIMYWDTGTNHIYISVGTTSADWVKLN